MSRRAWFFILAPIKEQAELIGIALGVAAKSKLLRRPRPALGSRAWLRQAEAVRYAANHLDQVMAAIYWNLLSRLVVVTPEWLWPLGYNHRKVQCRRKLRWPPLSVRLRLLH
jgi:hypothetical protein